MKRVLTAAGILLAIIVLAPLLAGLVMKAYAPVVPPPGVLVNVGGHKLHIHCSGSLHGSPPVLIEAGLGVSSSYYYWLQKDLERWTKVCTYDRAGLGWSEESHRLRELSVVVVQLHTLLDNAKFERPFVFAGHSIGAIIVREYVTRYPAEVAGLAFLDGSHPNQMKVLGLEKVDQKAQAERGLELYRLLVNSGLSRFYDPALAAEKESFPKAVIAQLQDTTGDSYFEAVRAEFSGLVPYTNRPRPADSFGDRPTAVIQAGETWDASSLPKELDPAKVAAGWSKLQHDTAALSSRGKYMVVSGANHMSLIYDKSYADQAAEQIAEVMQAAAH